MMQKNIMSIIIFLMVFCNVPFAEDTNQFEIKAIPVGNNLILGEPIMVRGVVKYIGTRSLYISPYTKDEIEIEGKCEGSRYWHTDYDMLLDWKKKQEISPGWQSEKVEYITWCVKIPKKLKVRYHFYFEPPAEKGIPAEIWQGHAISEWQEIEITYPIGVDAEAFQTILGPNPTIKVINEWINVKKDQILSKFPTSIYAGWVLAGGGIYDEDHLNIHYLKKANLKHYQGSEAAKKRMKEVNDGLASYASTRIEILSKYLKDRPDFALADHLKYEIAFQRAYREEYKETIVVLEALLQAKQTSDIIRKKCIALLEAVRERQK